MGCFSSRNKPHTLKFIEIQPTIPDLDSNLLRTVPFYIAAKVTVPVTSRSQIPFVKALAAPKLRLHSNDLYLRRKSTAASPVPL